MKRVVIDISSAIPITGAPTGTGIGRTTYELVHALDCRSDLPFQLGLFAHRLKKLPFGHSEFSTPIQHLRLPRWGAAYRLTCAIPIVEHMTRADLIHSPTNITNVCRMDRVVLTIHDAMSFSYPEAHLHRPEKAAQMVQHARQCRAIITCSKSSKCDITRYIGVEPDKITVIPWGYNRQIFNPEKDAAMLHQRLRDRYGLGPLYFFSVSCDIGRKRSDHLLDQYVKLLSDNPANDLVLVWRNPPAHIMSLAESQQIAGRVHIINSVTDSELRDLYCGATAMFYPSVYEGFGLPVLEAMACGTPVVTTKAASLPEVGGNAALYVSTENDDEVLACMRQFENGVIDRQALSSKSLEQAARFSWERCADRTIQVYRECLGI